LQLSGSLGDWSFDREISDATVLAAMGRFSDPGEGVESLIGMGARALSAASATFDVGTLRTEIERALNQTAEAFDHVNTQVKGAVGEDGPLAAAMAKYRADLCAVLTEAISKQSDPTMPGSLLSRIQAVVKDFGEALARERRETTTELQTMSKEHSAAIAKALQELTNTLAANRATAAERERGPGKGWDFEELVAREVAAIAGAHGDLAEHTGATPGVAITNRGRARRGDVTCTILQRDGVRLVVEAMDREKGRATADAIVDELSEAMGNRGAQAAIAVLASSDNNLMPGRHYAQLRPGLWAVVLDKEQPSPIALNAAYCVARQAALAAMDPSSDVDFDALAAGIEEVNGKLKLLGVIRTYLKNIATGQEQAWNALTKFEHEVREATSRLLNSIVLQSDQAGAA